MEVKSISYGYTKCRMAVATDKKGRGRLSNRDAIYDAALGMAHRAAKLKR